MATMTASRIGLPVLPLEERLVGGDGLLVQRLRDLPHQGVGSSLPTRRSTAAASSRRCCLTSQRGLSGIRSTSTKNSAAGSAAMPSIHRQALDSGPPTRLAMT